VQNIWNRKQAKTVVQAKHLQKMNTWQRRTSIETWLKKATNTIPRIAIISSRTNSKIHDKNTLNGMLSEKKNIRKNAKSNDLSQND